MSDLEDSSIEKRKSFELNGYIERWMFVHELRKLLDQLYPDDWLTPNKVGNLCINRSTIPDYIGIIDFHSNSIEYFTGDTEES